MDSKFLKVGCQMVAKYEGCSGTSFRRGQAQVSVISENSSLKAHSEEGREQFRNLSIVFLADIFRECRFWMSAQRKVVQVGFFTSHFLFVVSIGKILCWNSFRCLRLSA